MTNGVAWIAGAAVVGALTLTLTPLDFARGLARLDPLTSEQQLVRGLDHVPIAVRDLDAAADDYRRMGFVLKPGTAHANGIRNLHAKFADGTELELLTAPEARDDLTRQYVRHLEAGDGPAFAGFFAPDLTALEARLTTDGRSPRRAVGLLTLPDADPLGYVFFGGRNQSPTDLPEHFAHANSATRLSAIWLAAPDLGAERLLLESVGGAVTREEVFVPLPTRAVVVRFAQGEVRLLAGGRQHVPGRRVVGVTLLVRNAAAAAVLLGGSTGVAASPVETPGGVSVFAPPFMAHGLWIEFHEPRPRANARPER